MCFSKPITQSHLWWLCESSLSMKWNMQYVICRAHTKSESGEHHLHFILCEYVPFCTEAVHCVALWTRVTLGLDMCDICTEAVHGVALWTRVTLGLDMCDICTEAVHCVALWTRVTLGLDMCKVCTEAVHGVALWTRVTLGLDMCDICTEAVHSVALWTRVTLSFGHVWHMYRSSPFRSTLNTGYIKLWTCVTYVPKQSIP